MNPAAAWARRGRVARLAASVVAIAAGAALLALLALLQTPAAALADTLEHGGGDQLQPPAGLQSSGTSDPGTSPATPTGSAIAALALAQVGRNLDGPNTIDGRGFLSSNSLPDAWCAEFAAWVWSSRGVPIDGLDGWAGSFLSYGAAHGSYHAGGPRVGDAAVFALSPGVAAAAGSGTLGSVEAISHVGIVVAVSSSKVTIVNGDWGDGHGGAHLVRISTNAVGHSDAGAYASGMKQYVAGYVDPAGL